MDIVELGSVGRGAGRDQQVEAVDERCKQVATEFEGIFLRQMLERMKDTIDEFEADDEEQDSSGEQIKGMFWSFLGDAIAREGGFGFWQHIYEEMPPDCHGILNERA